MVCIHSRNGFVSTAWGPVLWFFLHNRAAQRQTALPALRAWFLLVGTLLPCRACRDNFTCNLAAASFDPRRSFASHESASAFLVHFHHVVNACLHKPRYTGTTTATTTPAAMYEIVVVETPSPPAQPTPVYGTYTPAERTDNITHVWWFLQYVVALNVPDNGCAATHERFLDLSIQLLHPPAQRNALRALLRTHRGAFDRDTHARYVDHLFRTGAGGVPVCFLAHLEHLRASDCTASTPTTEGTCAARSTFRTSIRPRIAGARVAFPCYWARSTSLS